MESQLIPPGQRLRTFRGPIQRQRIDRPFFRDNQLLYMPRSRTDARLGQLIYSDQRRRDLRDNPPVLEHVWKKSEFARELNYPLQLQNAQFLVTLTAPREFATIIKRNARRYSWRVANADETADPIYWSYGAPPTLQSGFEGIPVLGGESDGEAGSVVSVDEICVWTNSATPIIVCAFEGTIAPEANAL